MNYPAALKYSKSHLWLKMEGDVATIGITDFAQDALGDVVFINFPQEGDTVIAGERFGDVESVKTTSDLVCPVSGKVCEINESLADTPDDLNLAPYRHWIIKVDGITGTQELMDSIAYEAFCALAGQA